jgi:hypothetical protein
MDPGPGLPARSETRFSLRPAKSAAYSSVTRSLNDAGFHEFGDGNTAFMLLDRQVLRRACSRGFSPTQPIAQPKRATMIAMVLAAIVMFRFAVVT